MLRSTPVVKPRADRLTYEGSIVVNRLRIDQRRLALAGLTLAVFTACLLWQTGPVSGAPETRSPSARPTIVLVHGAWADASGWNGVTRRLQRDGYTVIAPANPLRDLNSDSAYLASVLQTITGPIVLVGHSYGGMVTTNAAAGNPQVKALVYITGFAPDAGESVGSIEAMNPGSQLGPASLVVRPFPGGLDAYIDPAAFREAFAADVPTKDADQMAAAQRPIAAAVLGEPSGVPAWKTIPSWYMVGSCPPLRQ
jgi:pimeloyl-ACP methyl ester carboxylesterase